MRTGPRIFRGGCGARLSAAGGPPAGSVFWQLAHFAAAGGGLCKGATTVATGDGRAGPGGRVRPDGVGGDARKKQEFQGEPDRPAAETVVARGAHEKSVEGKEGKTSSARGIKKGQTGVLVRNRKNRSVSASNVNMGQ